MNFVKRCRNHENEKNERNRRKKVIMCWKDEHIFNVSKFRVIKQQLKILRLKKCWCFCRASDESGKKKWRRNMYSTDGLRRGEHFSWLIFSSLFHSSSHCVRLDAFSDLLTRPRCSLPHRVHITHRPEMNISLSPSHWTFQWLCFNDSVVW